MIFLPFICAAANDFLFIFGSFRSIKNITGASSVSYAHAKNLLFWLWAMQVIPLEPASAIIKDWVF